MIPLPMIDVVSAVAGALHGANDRATVRRVTTDSRDVMRGDLFVAIRGERFDGHAFIQQAVDAGIVGVLCDRAWYESAESEAVRRDVCCVVVDDTIEGLGKLASYYRSKVMPVTTVVVGVTGTNGKTTTKSMLHHVLGATLPGRAAPRSFNNHIGVPLTLLSAEAGDRYLIVEIGSSAPGEIDSLSAMAKPHVGVITSIGEAHLEGFGGIEGVVREKTALLRHVAADGLVVVNIDRSEIRDTIAKSVHTRLITIGSHSSAKLSVADARGDIHHTTFELDGRFHVELPMPGLHHATNAAATFAVARWFGLPPEMILKSLRTVPPLEGRTRVLDLGRVTIVDDSYNANPSSTDAAVHTLSTTVSTRRVMVIGDMLELGDEAVAWHRRTLRGVLETGIEWLVAVGPLCAAAAVGLDTGGDRVALCEDASSAYQLLQSQLLPGDTVWVKGSRAMRLDCLVDQLAARFDRETAVA